MPAAPAKRPSSSTASTPSPEPPPRWFEFKNQAGSNAAELNIRGIIGDPTEWTDPYYGVVYPNPDGAGTFNEFEAALLALGNVTELTINIFSPGGDYFTGMAIHDRLCRHPANKVCVIDGQCDSAATYIALACETVKMPSNASMMIHRVSGGCWGNAEDMRQTADDLETIDSNIAQLYADRCGKDIADMLQMMDDETRFTGSQAHEIGLCDEVLASPKAKRAQPAPTVSNRVLNFRPLPAARPLIDNLRNPESAPTNTAAMIRRPSNVLLNAVDKPAAGGGGAAPAAPAPGAAPAAPLVPPAPPAAPPPVQNFSLDDIKNAFAGVIDEKLKPIIAEQDRIKNLAGAGITPGTLAGAPPAAVSPPAEKTESIKPENYRKVKPAALIAFGRENLTSKGGTAKLDPSLAN